jgi:hypothetical protein
MDAELTRPPETLDFEAFKAAALAAGYNEVLRREWLPDQVVPEHTHPFAVQARVARGEFWLQCEGQTRHLSAGAGFELALGVPHSERYGPVGATLWVARRHAA